MSRFKAGDLAIVVGAVNTPQNIGRTVTLEVFLPANSGKLEYKGSTFASSDVADCWIVSAEGLISYAAISDKKFHHKTGIAVCRQRHLMPLKGDPDELKDDESEPIKRSSGVPA